MYDLMELWMVCLEVDDSEFGIIIIGVFESEIKAIKACTPKSHFCGPILLNQRLIDDPEEWEGAYYPYK